MTGIKYIYNPSFSQRGRDIDREKKSDQMRERERERDNSSEIGKEGILFMTGIKYI